MELFDAIKKRQSIRKYQDKAIEREKLERVLEAGRLAPSARNDQTWHFYAVEDDTVRQKLIKAADNQSCAQSAPCILALTAPKERTMTCGQKAGSIDCSIALSFMLLAATEEGLGTVWLGHFYEDIAHEALNLSDDEMVVALCPIGYPAEEPPQRPRKDFDEIVTFI